MSGFGKILLAWATPFNRWTQDSPVFALGVRNLKHYRTPGQMARYSLGTFLFMGAAIVVLTAIHVYSQNTYNAFASTPLLSFTTLMGGGAFIGFLLMDLLCVLSALRGIHDDIAAKRWDLLRVTLLTPQQIVYAKYGVALARAWYLFFVMFSLRMYIVLLFIITVFTEQDFNGRTIAESVFGGLENDAPTVALMLTAMLWLFGVYLIEPLWRWRAMIALGLSLSARESSANAMLRAVAHLLFGWVVQGFALVLMVWIFGMAGNAVFEYLDSLNNLTSEEILLTWMVMFNLYMAFFVATVYGYFWLLRRVRLGHVIKQAFKD